ncbi:MAG: MoaD/ThiS family protein [Pirellulaceae bacterium]|nr:MoaD/ThiS family protein [Pirellulaceae bacterium]
MKIQLKLFAAARQAVDRETVQIELPDTATVADLRAAIARQFPALDATARHSLFAVNNQYADDATALPPDAEVACIPPVSGG